ncbi:hypothetical protein H2508_06915 [Parahaliea sp. F7430]|uniref:Uncharacterized protein n=1 Tax=Sediminihaliea albiluteola TaxID=2758564 RepID=A0A7W2TVR0_9GAMM|nr:hypothetical protein [Sediminihaliea albiluteola]MBA6412838.1 hypothetical protein [Sediminihaliea albiluteola]
MNAFVQFDNLVVYQALCPEQFSALRRGCWRRIESGRDGERFCYLKLQQHYAEMVARRRLLPVHGAGFVVRLHLPRRVLDQYKLETVAYDEHLEYRVPVVDLPRVQAHLVSDVKLVASFRESQHFHLPRAAAPLAALMG